jgi:MarR family transcriptional regulator, lower aerobic nicotinate degradation pathway regulator
MARPLTTAITTARVPYGVLLARLGQDATARFRRALRPLGLGAQQFIVLKQLEAIGSTSQGALADALGIDYSNLATVAGELCDKGLIVRAREECDRRRYALELTDEGRALLADADAAIETGEHDMLSALDEGERSELWELLRRVADSLELCPGTEAQACAEAEGQDSQ